MDTALLHQFLLCQISYTVLGPVFFPPPLFYGINRERLSIILVIALHQYNLASKFMIHFSFHRKNFLSICKTFPGAVEIG